MALGCTGAGKSFFLNFTITNLQKYEPYTFIFDLGGSFEALTQFFEGQYARVGIDSPDIFRGFALELGQHFSDALLVVGRSASSESFDDYPLCADSQSR
jgi:hypothetical protein